MSYPFQCFAAKEAILQAVGQDAELNCISPFRLITLEIRHFRLHQADNAKPCLTKAVLKPTTGSDPM